MATLTIRQLDDGVYDRLKRRARTNNRSVEAEVRQLLEERTQDGGNWIGELRDFHRRMEAAQGLSPDSTALIRQMRDEE